MRIRKRIILLAVLAAAVLVFACAAGEETPLKAKMPETVKTKIRIRTKI